MSYTIYVGPFVRCKYHLAKVPNIQKVCSVNVKHSQYYGKFCPECGAAVVEEDWGELAASVSPWDVFARAGIKGEPMCEYHGEGAVLGSELLEHWYVPNVSRGRPRDFFIDSEVGCGIVSAGAEIDPIAEIKWIETAFKAEIFALLGAYDDIRVDWGIILHYS